MHTNSLLFNPHDIRAAWEARCDACHGQLIRFQRLSGYVYLLSNPDMPSVVKIGQTTDTVEERVRQLTTTGVPSPFVIEAYFPSPSPLRHEQQIHQMLQHARRERREFFAISAAKAYAAMQAIIKIDPAYVRPQLQRDIEALLNQNPSSASDDDLLDQIRIL